MDTMGAETWIDLWSRGRGRHALERALLLLQPRFPEWSPSCLAAMPLGQRNAHLIRLRLAWMGPRLELNDRCPACREAVFFPVEAATLLASDQPLREAYQWEHEGYRVVFRPPSSVDLAAVLSAAEADQAAETLLRRVVLSVEHEGAEMALAELPPSMTALLEDAVAMADPLAEIYFSLTCTNPGCGFSWKAILDMGAFLWVELEDQVLALLRQVDVLARAYGWSEAEILGLAPDRRQFYLELSA